MAAGVRPSGDAFAGSGSRPVTRAKPAKALLSAEIRIGTIRLKLARQIEQGHHRPRLQFQLDLADRPVCRPRPDLTGIQRHFYRGQRVGPQHQGGALKIRREQRPDFRQRVLRHQIPDTIERQQRYIRVLARDRPIPLPPHRHGGGIA